MAFVWGTVSVFVILIMLETGISLWLNAGMKEESTEKPSARRPAELFLAIKGRLSRNKAS